MREIRHSVFMITYNQEDLIDEAIQSIIKQTVLPYEIVVSDDCSHDTTWDILLKYKEKYPDLFKIYRNEKNLGIHPNFNKVIKLCNGDVISGLAGDDFYESNQLFEKMNEIIVGNNFDLENDRYIISTNTKVLYPNGKTTICDNLRLKGTNIFKEQIRDGVAFRAVGYSKNLLQFMIADEDNLHGADGLKNTNIIANTDSFYFLDLVSSVYRVGVGVTASMKIDEGLKNKKKTLMEYRRKFKDVLDEKDLLFLKFKESSIDYKLRPSFRNWLRMFVLYARNYNNFAINNGFAKNFKIIAPFTNLLYKIRKIVYGY